MPDKFELRTTLNHLGRVAPQTGWGMVEHVHADFHEFILVLRGDITTTICGETLRGQRGDVLFYPAGEPHAEKAAGKEPLETLFLGWQWIGSKGDISNSWPLQVNDRNGRIRMVMEWMREHYPPEKPGDARNLDLLIETLVFEYDHLAQSSEQAMIRQIKTFIQHRLSEPISLDDLASEVRLSKYHFSREFKRLTGTTPMAFLRQERVAATRSLLLSTPWTLKAISQQVGFADEYQLSRIFRRLTGKPPSHLRRK
ncbi:MAG: AraC family transcriptional regulator [Anaerolineaceae bacterium]|nr:AraC family transcriptional regulator [Anaerolineaceae bacterium]